jgi:hypothetical protein
VVLSEVVHSFHPDIVFVEKSHQYIVEAVHRVLHANIDLFQCQQLKERVVDISIENVCKLPQDVLLRPTR